MKIFSDFDGTLTCNGQLGTIFFDILSEIKRLNSELIIVSGRSLSWGHFFLTHFPIRYCLMEGGGVVVYKDQNGDIREENLVSEVILNELEAVTQKLCLEIPETIMSADSFGRRADRAIEIYHQTPEVRKKIENFLTMHNVHYSFSNVHLNFWMGEISKARGVAHFLKKYFQTDLTSDCLYFGDALNDESMFKYFEHSIGVSNINDVLDKLEYKPKIVLEGKENSEAFGVYNYLKAIK